MNIIAHPSTPTITDLDEYLHYLIFSSSSITTSPLKVVWDLSEFYSNLPLPDAVRTELSRPPHRSKWGNYRLFYIPDKVFSITKNGSDAHVYSLDQYYPSESEPATLAELQQKADNLSQSLADLGIPRPATLSSPVACFKGHELLDACLGTVPTIFDAEEKELEAYEIALQCTPHEWVCNYAIGVYDDD